MKMVRCAKEIVAVQNEFNVKRMRFGALEEVLPLVVQRIPQGLVDDCQDDYVIRLEIHRGGYSLYANQKKKSLARRSFFVDETGVLRESWGPGPATAKSVVAR